MRSSPATADEQALRNATLPAARELLLAAVMFLGAFLLFQVELVSAKFLLPWFGATPSVWTACVMFFQVILLAGYSYAHSTGRSFARLWKLHAGLLLLSLAVMAALGLAWGSPITPGPGLKPNPADNPVLKIVLLLGVSVGLPSFLLSTTSPLLQAWYALGSVRFSPYRLYAVSNLGSLLGIVTYPFLFEPLFPLHRYAWGWAGAFALYVAGSLACVWVTRQAMTTANVTAAGALETAADDGEAPPALADKLLWFGLAACGTMLFLATSNVVTQDLAAAPLLWVLPLGIYLLSFIIPFSGPFHRRELMHPALALLLAMIVNLLFRSPLMKIEGLVYVLSLNLLVCCLVCHGELSRLKPGARYLTSFYLLIAAGGAAGGVFVSVLAPRIFPDYWEFHLSEWLCAVLVAVVLLRDRQSWLNRARPHWAVLAVLGGGLLPLYFALNLGGVHMIGALQVGFLAVMAALLALLAVVLFLHVVRANTARLAWARYSVFAVPLLLAVPLVVHALSGAGPHLMKQRNFYGVLTVQDRYPTNPLVHAYFLLNGRITHGSQLQQPQLRDRATAYYTSASGGGMALLFHPRRWADSPGLRALRVGVVGLGAGTLAAYGQPGDYFRFYEINPAVIQVADGPHAYFTFLRDSKAKIDVVQGDARIELENEAATGHLQQFDVLVLDAFSGDAIPVHLLTKEAFKVYLQHLRGRDSVIAVHISNRHLDLEPVLAGIARHFALNSVLVHSEGKGANVLEANWVLLSRNSPILVLPQKAAGTRPLAGRPVLWTDDYSELVSLLR
jgi:hypothetical protein